VFNGLGLPEELREVVFGERRVWREVVPEVFRAKGPPIIRLCNLGSEADTRGGENTGLGFAVRQLPSEAIRVKCSNETRKSNSHSSEP